MFGKFKSLLFEAAPSKTKVMASSSFLDGIEKAKADVQLLHAAKEKEYDDFIKNGKKLLRQFAKTNDNAFLKQSADMFLQAVKIRQSKIEPHVNLAYIFCLYDLKDDAFNHFKIAEKLDPSHPMLNDIRGMIFA